MADREPYRMDATTQENLLGGTGCCHICIKEAKGTKVGRTHRVAFMVTCQRKFSSDIFKIRAGK